MIVAAKGYDVSMLTYAEQCEYCESQIENLTKIWRQRVTPRIHPQSGLHVWVLTSGRGEEELTEESRHSAEVVDVVSFSISTALRTLYKDCIGTEGFLEITWKLSPHNMDLFKGDTPEYEDFYWLTREKVL